MFFKMLNHRDVVPTQTLQDEGKITSELEVLPEPDARDTLSAYHCSSQIEIDALQKTIRLSQFIGDVRALTKQFWQILYPILKPDAAAFYQFHGEKWQLTEAFGAGEEAFFPFTRDWEWRENLPHERRTFLASGEEMTYVFGPLLSGRLVTGMVMLRLAPLGEEDARNILGFVGEMVTTFSAAQVSSQALTAV
ncbi:MAG TPA: hypothetical protein PLG66_19845, partial [Calditrichia bacterium]|nr:hypothetical protein [Calditrichia bacterium]